MENTVRIAAKHVEERLEAYVKPDNDPTMGKDLKRYVTAMLIWRKKAQKAQK